MSVPDQDREEKPTGMWAGQGQYLGHGMAAAFSTLLIFLVGLWLDGKLGTTPLLTFGGAFLGGAAVFYKLYAHLIVEPEDSEEEEHSDEGEVR